MYIIGFSLYTLAITLTALAPSVIVLIVFRVFQGISGAMVLANSDALVTNAFPRSERGKALGILGASAGLGLGLGPTIGGLLVDGLGWESIFWIRAPLGCLCILLAVTGIPKDHRQGKSRPPLDYLGPLALASMMTTFLLAINIAGRGGLHQTIVWILAVVSILMLIVLIKVELRAPWPVVEMKQFRNRVFASAQSSQVSHYMAHGILFFLAAFYLIDGLGMGPVRAGLMMTVFPVIRVIGGPVSGSLSDKVGTRLPVSLGLVVMGFGLLFMSSLSYQDPIWMVIAAFALTGIGSSVFEPPNASAIMGSVGPERLSAAGASIATSRQISSSAGFTLGAAIFSLREQVYIPVLGSSSEAVSAAFGDAMMVAAGICFLGSVAAYLRGKI
jgi:MFS family permease